MTPSARFRATILAPLVTLLTTTAGPAAGAEQCHGSAAAVHAYVAAVCEARWGDARAAWSSAYLGFADANSIVPRSTPAWWDVASPVVRYADELATGRATVEVTARPDHEGAVATVAVDLPDGSASWTYTVVHETDGWRLAGRLWGASRRWPVLETRHFRIRHPARHLVDPAACEMLDRFAEYATGRLDGDRARLEAVPTTYLVADAATVEELTGHATAGMVDVASGIIVSSHFPHFHEVVHLLTGRLWPDLPVDQLPVFQEGIACLLGGRWGRSPEVVLHQGWVTLDWETVAPSDLLAAADFRRAPGGPDATYAVAALICDTIMRNSAGKLYELHREFSGAAAAASAKEVAAAVARACGWLRPGDPLDHLDAAVRERAAAWRDCGIIPDRGDPPAPLGITDDGAPWRVRLTGEDGPVVLLWGEPVDDSTGRASSVFAERVPDRIWRGRRWGLSCAPTSISLYDFVANRLHGVWVADFAGDEPLDAADMRFLLLEPPPEPVTGLVVHRPDGSP